MKTKIALLLTTVLLTIPAYARHGYFGIRGGFTETRETEIIDKYETELEFTRKFIHKHGLEFALASEWNKCKS